MSESGPRAQGPAIGGFLAGRHAVVTGGGRGIGAAVAEALARGGASVTLLGRRADAVEGHARHLADAHGVGTFAARCDVADEGSVAEAFAAARRRLGEVHLLVNNAGQAEAAPFERTTREQWERHLAVNLTGAFLCMQQVLPAMVAAGDGRVVSIASTAGLRGYTKLAAYCASKHGLVGLTRAVALETARTGVTVNAVCPAYTETDMARQGVERIVATMGKTPEEAVKLLVRTVPLGRMVRPEEVAAAVLWLSSPEAAAVTGLALPVSGGEIM